MLEVVGALVVLVLMVGIFMLMIPGLRPNGRKAHSVSFLHQYGEGSGWGVALMAGFAVYDMLRAVVTVSGAPQGMGLATMGFALCAAVGLSCTVTRGNGGVWQLPASLVGAVAAAWKTIVVAQESWARAEWTTVALVGAMAMVFGFTTVVRLLVGGLAGLAWYTALEVMLFLASPFGVELREMTGWSQGVMAFLMVAIPPQPGDPAVRGAQLVCDRHRARRGGDWHDGPRRGSAGSVAVRRYRVGGVLGRHWPPTQSGSVTKEWMGP